MFLLFEDKLHFIKYADEGQVFVKKDKLSLELHRDRWDMPLPVAWDFVINDEDAATTIRAIGAEPPFIVEGTDYLYYVSSRDSINSVAKEALFIEAIKESISADILNTAYINGYDTSYQNSNERMIRSAAIILNNAKNSEENVFRIPYLLPPRTVYMNDLDYSIIPDHYVIIKSMCQSVVNKLTDSLKNQIQLGPQNNHLPIYSFSCFISKIQLP